MWLQWIAGANTHMRTKHRTARTVAADALSEIKCEKVYLKLTI